MCSKVNAGALWQEILRMCTQSQVSPSPHQINMDDMWWHYNPSPMIGFSGRVAEIKPKALVSVATLPCQSHGAMWLFSACSQEWGNDGRAFGTWKNGILHQNYGLTILIGKMWEDDENWLLITPIQIVTCGYQGPLFSDQHYVANDFTQPWIFRRLIAMDHTGRSIALQSTLENWWTLWHTLT